MSTAVFPERPIGDRGAHATRYGFGSAPIGNLYSPVSDDDAIASLQAAWDGGIRYFDTAPHYGLGLSERRLGSFLAERPRHEYSVSTKVGRLLVPNPSPVGSDLANGFAVADDLVRVFDFSASGVRASLEASLDRLGLDHVDIALIHDPDDHLDQALDAAVPELIRMRDEGLVHAIGVGMNFVEPLRRFVRESDIDVVMVAGRWTLLDRSAAPLLDECELAGVSVLSAAPFNSGLLASDEAIEDGTFDYAAAPDSIVQRARSIQEACRAADVPLLAAAIQFPLRHPAVGAVVAGMRQPAEVISDVAAARVSIPEAAWEQIDRASTSGLI